MILLLYFFSRKKGDILQGLEVYVAF